MLADVVVVCLLVVSATASPTRDGVADSASPIHIIKPPVRCPEGMKPDANGRCRVVWDKSVDGLCPAGQEPDSNGVCRQAAEAPECFGEDCPDGISYYGDHLENHAPMEALKTEKRIKKRTNPEEGKPGKHPRSKHAFLIMLKKKKMQMLKPKVPPPPPPHHPPHHHPPHQEDSEEPPEENPAEEDTPAPERLFFGDDACIDDAANSTGECPPAAEVIHDPETDDFKEWKPDESSESSDSDDSSSSSDSGSQPGSAESQDELLQKAIQIKLMKLFRMKQRYGPALRRWLVTQLRDYEDSFDY